MILTYMLYCATIEGQSMTPWYCRRPIFAGKQADRNPGAFSPARSVIAREQRYERIDNTIVR
jgi:hypothetical protein